MNFQKLIKEIFNLSYFKEEGREMERISEDFSLILSYVEQIKKLPLKESSFFFHEKKKIQELRSDKEQKKIDFSLEKVRSASPFGKDNFFMTKKIL
jgi:hypothetical protein